MKKNHFIQSITLFLCIVFCISTLTSCSSLLDEWLDYSQFESETGSKSVETEEDNSLVIPEEDRKTIEESGIEKESSTGSQYGSAGSDPFAISTAVKMVQDAVVVINATIKTTDYYGRSTTATSSGSGVIVSEKGYILTCYHVIEGAESVQIIMNDESEYSASLVGASDEDDLAVLQINTETEVSFPYSQLGSSSDLIAGEMVFAIGNPLGTLGGTVTSGIISAPQREIEVDGETMTLIQTDAAINSGNSGGGLFNLKGELIGIVNAKYASTGVEGLGFAIPVDIAYDVMQELIEKGYVGGKVYAGLSLYEITSSELNGWYSQNYRRYGITKAGVYINTSEINTDLEYLDRIVSIDGVEITTTEEVSNIVQNHKVGDQLTIVYEKNDEKYATQHETILTLAEYVPDYMKEILK